MNLKQELGIYIHIPFCKQKCYYCNFVSFANKEELQKRYISCLKKELIQKYNKVCNNYNITSIYIGGGTPSLVDSKYIKEILELLKNKIITQKNSKLIEITIEVNPGTVTKQKLIHYKEAGINRLSIGLQSTNNKLLKEIGRIHTYEEFLETYKLARELGFKNINVDIMLGLPNQKIEDLKNSLKAITQLKPEHISVYSLILEEGTVLFEKVNKGEISLPNEELERQMYWYVKNTLELNEYNHYEISNFTKKGFESKHNVNCWKQKEYLGVGLAASSYTNATRYSNITDLNKYMENIEIGEIEKNKIIEEVQQDVDKQKEFMMLGLRMLEGVSIQEFKNRFAQNPLYEFREELNKLVENKLIQIDGDKIMLTNKGLDLANQVWMEFV